ncbi:innexin unc-9-like [Pecten maximus]|uniref:innexin unc-9-like n=1 Tax=Pecten maximus TaxID=6579 RepID=UPI0014580263|nr:innexin unc-9-like [Pecten maximus]
MPLVTLIYQVIRSNGKSADGNRYVYDDNIIDRLSHYHTNMILMMFTAMVVTKHYVGSSIQCFCPTHFTATEVKYTNRVCWVSNTYYIPFTREIPSNYEVRMSTEITYYQWVPVMLLLIAMVLKLPRLVWRLGLQMSGIGLKNTLKLTHLTQDLSPEDREKRLRALSKYIGRWSSSSAGQYRSGICGPLRERLGNYCFLGCGRHYGNYVVSLAIVIRSLYFVNNVGLLFFLNEFLGNKFYLFGYEVIASVLKGEEWVMSPRFPLVTLCDLDLRQMTNVQRWTLQCVLPVNFYNERFFVFLWFWFTMLAVLSFINLIALLFSTVVPQNRESFIKKYLLLNNLDQWENKSAFPKLITKFVGGFLKPDGVYLLKLISSNSQSTGVSDIIKYLWEDFREQSNMTCKNRADTIRKFGRPNADSIVRLVNGTGTLHHRHKEYFL